MIERSLYFITTLTEYNDKYNDEYNDIFVVIFDCICYNTIIACIDPKENTYKYLQLFIHTNTHTITYNYSYILIHIQVPNVLLLVIIKNK